jgi:hypothetical protein
MLSICMLTCIYGAYMLTYLHIDEVWGEECIGWCRFDWGKMREYLGKEAKLWTHS